MSYFIFLKDKDNIENTIYKIAENENDLTTLNIIQNTYKIIKDDSIDFLSIPIVISKDKV
jgi:hypothetical protein